MPAPVWHGASHFGFHCVIDGDDAAVSERFCRLLGPVGTEKLKLPFRANPGPDGVTLRLNLRLNGGRLVGTLVAFRPALRGETDETSPTIPVSLDAAAPVPGFVRALALLRTPQTRPRVRQIVRTINS